MILTGSMLLSGCEIMGKKIYFKTGAGSDNIFRVSDLYCPENEAKTYILNTKNIYGNVYDNSVLSKDFNSKEVASGIEKKALDHLIRVYALCLYSEENKIELSDDEKAILSQITDELGKAGISASVADRILTDASGIEAAGEAGRVIVVERLEKSSFNSIAEEVTLLRELKIDRLGAVVFE